MDELVSCQSCHTYFRGARCPRCGLAVESAPAPAPQTEPAPRAVGHRPFIDDAGELPPPPEDPGQLSFENRTRTELIAGLSAFPLALVTGHLTPTMGAMSALAVMGVLPTKLDAALIPFFSAAVVMVSQVVAIGWVTLTQLKAHSSSVSQLIGPEFISPWSTLTAVAITFVTFQLFRKPRIGRAVGCMIIEALLTVPILFSFTEPAAPRARVEPVHQLLIIIYAITLLVIGSVRVHRAEVERDAKALG